MSFEWKLVNQNNWEVKEFGGRAGFKVIREMKSKPG